MSRNYANFLLLEDVLDNTSSTLPIFKQALGILLNPSVRVVEENCGTLLGKTVETTFDLEGLLEVATGDTFTKTRLTNLLAAGVYQTSIRELHSCLSHTKGGICRKCFSGSFIGSTANTVGQLQKLTSSIIYQSDRLIGTGRPSHVIDPDPLHAVFATRFALTQTQDDYYDLKVIQNGAIVSPTLYSLGYDYIDFPGIVPLNDTYVVHFYKGNAEPFQGFLAKTYSGGLLGMEPLPTVKPLLAESLYSTLLPSSFVDSMFRELQTLKAIPKTYLDYISKIHGTLEKVLCIMYFYSIYSQVQV